MPTRECNYQLENGFRCKKTFTVPSNTWKKYRCPEHEHHSANRGNLRAASATLSQQKIDLRKFVQDFKDDTLPDIQVKLLEGIHEREELSKRIDEITEGEWQGSLAPTSLEDLIRSAPELSLDFAEYKVQVDEFYDEMSKVHSAYIKQTKTAHSNSMSDFRTLKKEIDDKINDKLDSFSLKAEVINRFANLIIVILVMKSVLLN